MKKILLLFIIVFTTTVSLAQKGSRERIKSLKIAHITEQIDLTAAEAEKFWPIYNDHEKIIDQIKKQERKSFKSLKETDAMATVSENDAEAFLKNHLSTEEQKLNARKKLIKDLQEVISHKKILMLVKAEMDFNRNLIRQLRNRRKAN